MKASKRYKWNHFKIGEALGYLSVMPNLRELIYDCVTEPQVDHVLTNAREKMEKKR